MALLRKGYGVDEFERPTIAFNVAVAGLFCQATFWFALLPSVT